LGHSEVDMEQDYRAGRGRFWTLAGQDGPQPVGVDEAFITREPLDREGFVGRPFGPAALVTERGDSALAETLDEACGIRAIVAVDNDLLGGGDPLGSEQDVDLAGLDAGEPRLRERDRPGDVAASMRRRETPTVERGDRQ